MGNAPMRLGPYLAYSDDNRDELPLYLFDKVGARVQCGGSDAGAGADADECALKEVAFSITLFGRDSGCSLVSLLALAFKSSLRWLTDNPCLSSPLLPPSC